MLLKPQINCRAALVAAVAAKFRKLTNQARCQRKQVSPDTCNNTYPNNNQHTCRGSKIENKKLIAGLLGGEWSRLFQSITQVGSLKGPKPGVIQ